MTPPEAGEGPPRRQNRPERRRERRPVDDWSKDDEIDWSPRQRRRADDPPQDDPPEEKGRSRPQKPSVRLPPGERRRRLKQRGLPLAVLALGAFVFGAISSAGSAEQDTASRFVEAWADQDFAGMHAELTAESQAQFPADQLAALYQEAQAAATATSIDPGDTESPKDGVVAVEVGVGTEIFGNVGGNLLLPMSDAKIVFAPHLTFPGLAEGERVGRRLTLGERAAILAKDGKTALAQGPADDRSSPLGSDAIDVAGEVGTPDAELRPEVEQSGYPGDQDTGVSGLELAFNSRLAGRPGGELLAVPEGTELPDVPRSVEGRVLAQAQQEPGEPLRTTIDPDLQQTSVAALGGRSGGVVVLDARNGQVRALAGSAYSSLQPPGSIFKIITTTAALEENKVKLDDTFPVVTEINPAPETGGRVISNAHEEPCGGVFEETFANSCNTVFAPLGVEVGAEKLVDTSERYGFNSPPTLYDEEATAAVDPGEMTIPDEFDETGTELSVTAIGQGEVLATPLGMASMAQTVAAGGKRSATPIVSDPELQADFEPVQVTSKENARVLTGLMRAVVEYGTGTAAALPGVQVAGKTGTAELGPKPGQPPPEPGSQDEQEQIVDAWFVAFAPARKPKLAIAVMLIDAEGDGGEVAAPVARDILGSALG